MNIEEVGYGGASSLRLPPTYISYTAHTYRQWGSRMERRGPAIRSQVPAPCRSVSPKLTRVLGRQSFSDAMTEVTHVVFIQVIPEEEDTMYNRNLWDRVSCKQNSSKNPRRSCMDMRRVISGGVGR
jgi:hypothetical protein